MLKLVPPGKPDPEEFTGQELIYLATFARAAAVKAEDDAAKRENPTLRHGLLDAAKVYRELAGKCERKAAAT